MTRSDKEIQTVSISASQYARILKAEQARADAERERDLILNVILEGTKYAGKDMTIINVNKEGIHLKYTKTEALPFKKVDKEG